MLKYMLEESMNLYYDKSFYTMVFTSLIIRIMISLDLHYYQKNPDFSYLEFFPPPFYNFFPLLFLSSSVLFSPTSYFIHFLMIVHPFKCPIPNDLFHIL